jgi:hypothetical protein
MNRRNIFYCLVSLILFSASYGCTPESPEPPTTTSAASPTPTSTASPASSKTKTDTISIEGEKRQIVLRFYDKPALPFTTYVPDTAFVDEVTTLGNGSAVRFYAKKPDGTANQAAYVQIAFPSEPVTVAKMTDSVTGKGGLLELNQWQLTSRSTAEADLYPWAREKIGFKQSNNNILGAVFVGESNGKAFTVIEHYPGDSAAAFAPLAGKILSNLQLRK